MQQIVLKEIELKVAQMNVEIQTKEQKQKKGSWEAEYTSSARTLLRTVWLMDFITMMFKLIDENRDKSLSNIGKESYSKTLGIHHPWVVRQAAKVAIYAMPSRETLILNTGLTFEQCKEISSNADLIKTELWAFFKEHKLDNLQ